jgi:4a-hydroxytetrahydrobiopterin dehydratase
MKVSQKEIEQFMSKHKGWSLKGQVLEKTFVFKDFKEAVEFVNKIEPIADSMNHHPDICIYYNRVIVQLTTHDVGGLTDLDIKLAEEIESLKK